MMALLFTSELTLDSKRALLQSTGTSNKFPYLQIEVVSLGFEEE